MKRQLLDRLTARLLITPDQKDRVLLPVTDFLLTLRLLEQSYWQMLAAMYWPMG